MGEERSHGATSTAIVRLKWRSRTAGFANGSVETIIQKACKHFKLGAIQRDLVLLAELDGEQLEVTDDLLGLVPKGTTFILSRIQSEDVLSPKPPLLHKRAKQVAIVDHVCTQDPRRNRASSSCIPRALGMMVFIAPPGPLDRLVGTKFALECEYTKTIKDVKAKIEERTGMSRNLQGLFFRGLELQEGCTLSDYNIQKENTLHLVAASLVSKWSFLHVDPLIGPTRLENRKQRVKWLVSARSDRTLVEKDPNLELSYLF